MLFALISLSYSNPLHSYNKNVVDLKKDIYIYSRDINVTVSHHNNAFMHNYKKPEYILDKFVEYSVKYNKEYGIKKESMSDCSSDTLNIVYVSEEYLNDPHRMEIWFGSIYASKFENRRLIALYDYRNYESNIYITDSRYKDNGITFEERLAHEISHFWYKKSCLDVDHPDNEVRALEFEKIMEK